MHTSKPATVVLMSTLRSSHHSGDQTDTPAAYPCYGDYLHFADMFEVMVQLKHRVHLDDAPIWTQLSEEVASRHPFAFEMLDEECTARRACATYRTSDASAGQLESVHQRDTAGPRHIRRASDCKHSSDASIQGVVAATKFVGIDYYKIVPRLDRSRGVRYSCSSIVLKHLGTFLKLRHCLQNLCKKERLIMSHRHRKQH